MRMDTERTLGAVIRAKRMATGITLAELARAVDMDVSQLSKVERGLSRTSVPAYDRIADALGWTPAAMWRAATSRRAA